MRPLHRISFLLLLQLLSSLSLAFCSPSSHMSQRDKWYQSSEQLESLVWPLKHRFTDILQHLTRDFFINYSHNCRQDLMSLHAGLISGSREAFMLFDSFTKTHAGFLGERLYDYGAYDQCLNSRFNKSSGRYIILHLHRPLPHDLKETKYEDISDSWISENSKTMSALRTYNMPVALCLPDSCSHFDVQQIIDSERIKNLVHPNTLSLLTTESLNDPIVSERPWLQVVSRIAIAVLIMTVVLSTIIHYLMPDSKFLQSFDAVSNTNKLFAEGKEENKNLTFFNGIRALYLILNIPSHVGIPHIESTFHSNFPIFRSVDKLSPTMKVYTMTAPHYVSSNVLMAACLSAIGWLPQMKKNPGKVSFFAFVVLRALRTLPVVLAMIVLTFTFPIVGHGVGPMMGHMQKTLSNKCYQFGWKDLFFISNFGSFHEMCMPVGWFMSADFQLYVLSFLYLGFLNSRPRLGFSLIGLQVVAGIAYHAHYLLSADVHTVLKLWTWDPYNNLHGYIKLFAHTANYVAVYPIGVVLGYLMVNGHSLKVKSPATAFCAFIMLCNITLFSPVLLYDGGEDGDGLDFVIGGRVGEAVFGSIYRVLFVICYSGVCLLLHSYPDFIVSRLFSSRFLTVVSRFSYSAFIAHPLVIMFTLSSIPDILVTQTFMNMMYLYIIVLSFFFGFLMFLLVEAPAMNLLKSWAASRIRDAGHEKGKRLQEDNNNDDTSTISQHLHEQ